MTRDSSFAAASAVRRAAPGRYALDVDPTWLQGRGAFGGLVAAWLVRAMEAEVDDPARPLRALTCELCAPARPGPAEVQVRTLRAGLNVSFLAAEVSRHGRVVARATGVFGRALADPAWPRPMPPAVPPAGAVPLWAPPMPLPVYCQHVRHARCLGSEVLSGPAVEAALGGWTWFHEPTVDDAAARVALLDAWPPALFTRLTAPRPVVTITMTCHLFGPSGPASPAVAPGTPLLVTARSDAAVEGYSDERLELWAPDGRLLATSHQVVGVLADGGDGATGATLEA